MFDFSAAPISFTLILLNVGVSLYALLGNQSLIERFAFIPERVRAHGESYRMLTSTFLHANFAHLLFNMITLFFFGPTIEQVMGPFPFLLIYFGSAFAASVWPMFKYKNNPEYAAVGASGSISGVLFAHCLFFPLNKLYLMFIPIGIPAVLFAVLFAGFSYYAASRPADHTTFFGRIAHEAHLGGALGGLLITLLLEPSVLWSFFRQILGAF
jgi:membrane associated rhomboid family serine protease